MKPLAGLGDVYGAAAMINEHRLVIDGLLLRGYGLVLGQLKLLPTNL